MKRSPVVRAVLAFGLAITLVVALAGQALAIDPHLHCLTTKSGNEHSIARGVTFNAPHIPGDGRGFHAFHSHAHVIGFDADHPLFPITAMFFPTSPEC